MQLQNNNPRYRIDTFFAPSLENNAIGEDPNKKIKIYLPPGYFSPENETKMYPTIYFLNGYGVSLEKSSFNTNRVLKKSTSFLMRLMFREALKHQLTYEKLDKLITRNEMKPFILVQVDGELPLPNYFKMKGLTGEIYNKGCMFMNSPYTGNYEDYTFHDAVKYVDSNFHTKATKSSRAVMGVSMGGYGALLAGIKHPDTFNAIVPISPLIDMKAYIKDATVSPMGVKTLGKEKAEEELRKDLVDSTDTVDMILFEEHELIENDEMISDFGTKLDAMDLNLVLNQYPNAFENVALAFYCEEKDENGFANHIRVFEEKLKNKNIPCTVDIFSNAFAQKYSSHIFGISFRMKDGILFCLDNMDS